MDAQTLINAELDAGERLLWFGAPSPARLAGRETAAGCGGSFMAAFGVFWLCVVGFIGFGAAQMGAPSIFPIFIGGMFLFGLVFVGFALKIAASPAQAAARAHDTVYAVTDRRLLVLVAGEGARSYTPRDIERVERRDLPDGSGDVVFARERETGYDTDNRHYERWKDLGFFGISNPREVERLIRQNLVS